jgi:hypothetical protein
MRADRRFFSSPSADPVILAICACFAVAAVFSGVWGAFHADHDCDGVDGCCSVCAQIVAAWDVLKQLGAAFGCETPASEFSPVPAVFISLSLLSATRPLSLAALKVRMNN